MNATLVVSRVVVPFVEVQVSVTLIIARNALKWRKTEMDAQRSSI
jgi:hypothetical protein